MPSPFLNVSAPRINVTIRGQEFPILLDSGAEVSVLPVELARRFEPPLQIPTQVREFRTFGPSNVSLVGPTPLEILVSGIRVVHPFYFSHEQTQPLFGYDLMIAARLVIDIDNQQVWSRRNPAFTGITSRSFASAPDPSARVCVHFVEPCLPAVVDPAVDVTVPESSSCPSGLVESAPHSSCSVVSRQVSVVLPSPGCRASFLNPHAPSFSPRARYSVLQDAPCPRADSPPPQPSSLSVCPPVDSDDTLVKLPPPASVLSLAPPPEPPPVPPHLQELFDATVDNAKLSSSLQQDLAAMLHRNKDAFATSSTDLGFCTLLQHDINVGDARPIKQPPRRPPFAARNVNRKQQTVHVDRLSPCLAPEAEPVVQLPEEHQSAPEPTPIPSPTLSLEHQATEDASVATRTRVGRSIHRPARYLS